MSKAEDFLKSKLVLGVVQNINPIKESDYLRFGLIRYEDALESVRIAREEEREIANKRVDAIANSRYKIALKMVKEAREEVIAKHKKEMEEEIIKERKKMLEHIKNFVEINIKARDDELALLCEKEKEVQEE